MLSFDSKEKEKEISSQNWAKFVFGIGKWESGSLAD